MEIVDDILINVLSDGISFLLGMLFVILYPFLKNSIRIKKLIQNSQNHLRVLMNFDCEKNKSQRVIVNNTEFATDIKKTYF